MLYVQLLAFPVLAWLGIWAGRVLGRGKRWWAGVAVTLAWVGVLVVGHRIDRMAFVPPMSWAVDADAGPLVMTPVVAVLFTILIMKLPQRRSVAVGTIMAVMLAYYGLLPAALPLVVRGSLAAGTTKMDTHQVCMQTHAYTCGPAAAVTCLQRLGVEAQEGALAIESRCAPMLGADGRLLADAITRRYGVTCAYRYAERLEDVSVPAVVDIWSTKVGGHYVALLAVETQRVQLGDPLSGEAWVPREEFMQQWRHGAVVLASDKRAEGVSAKDVAGLRP